MKICVLVKQVPDMDAPLEIDPDSGWLRPAGGQYVMNSFDAFAMQQALRLKESAGGIEVDALTVGPQRAEAAARRALAMGADNAMHVVAGETGPLSGRETAFLAAQALEGKGYDCILAGILSQDLMAGQTGPSIAYLLKIPWISAVVGLALDGPGRFRVQREIEGGVRETFLAPAPALFTIQSTSQTPRYPTLSHMLRANRTRIARLHEKDLTLPEPLESPPVLSLPPEGGAGEFLTGSPEEKALQLYTILHERALL